MGRRLLLSLGTISQGWQSSFPRLILRHIYSFADMAWVLDTVLSHLRAQTETFLSLLDAHGIKVSLLGCPQERLKSAPSFRYTSGLGAQCENGEGHW